MHTTTTTTACGCDTTPLHTTTLADDNPCTQSDIQEHLRNVNKDTEQEPVAMTARPCARPAAEGGAKFLASVCTLALMSLILYQFRLSLRLLRSQARTVLASSRAPEKGRGGGWGDARGCWFLKRLCSAACSVARVVCRGPVPGIGGGLKALFKAAWCACGRCSRGGSSASCILQNCMRRCGQEPRASAVQ